MTQAIQPLVRMFKSALKDKSAVVTKIDGSFVDFTVNDVCFRTYRNYNNELEFFSVRFVKEIDLTDCIEFADQLVRDQKEAWKQEAIQELELRLKELKNEQ